MSARFRNHLRDQGIIHLIFCPSTPQQNGIAERKHRHLTELGLSMLFQNHTPLKYWVEALYSPNFISNMIPSSVLSNKSPSEVLFNKTLDYSFLRIFGYACYPCLRPYFQHKFDPRWPKCVSLSYHSQYKGYRCLHPPTGRVYISRHVIFDKQIFPFTGQYKHFLVQHNIGLLKAWQDGTLLLLWYIFLFSHFKLQSTLRLKEMLQLVIILLNSLHLSTMCKKQQILVLLIQKRCNIWMILKLLLL